MPTHGANLYCTSIAQYIRATAVSQLQLSNLEKQLTWLTEQTHKCVLTHCTGLHCKSCMLVVCFVPTSLHSTGICTVYMSAHITGPYCTHVMTYSKYRSVLYVHVWTLKICTVHTYVIRMWSFTVQICTDKHMCAHCKDLYSTYVHVQTHSTYICAYKLSKNRRKIYITGFTPTS